MRRFVGCEEIRSTDGQEKTSRRPTDPVRAGLNDGESGPPTLHRHDPEQALEPP